MDNTKNNDLEHEILDFKIKKVTHDVDLTLRMMRAEMRAEFEVLNIRFDNFANFAKVAEVEISELKKDTAFIRDSKRWKWVVGLALIGLITTVNFADIKTWISGFFK